MKCPKDADSAENFRVIDGCQATLTENIKRLNGSFGKKKYECTRSRRHIGQHHAHDYKKRCLKIWGGK